MIHPRSINIVLIGAGYWGSKLLSNIDALGVLYGYVDDFAKHPIYRSMGLDEALADPLVTAVMIATPSHTHADLIERALRSGKHVFVEKPFCLSLDTADRLSQLAISLNKLLMIGYLMMFHPATHALKSMYLDNQFADCSSILIQRQDLLTPRVNESVWWDLTVHDISMLYAIFGSVPEHIQSIKHKLLGCSYDSMYYHGIIHTPALPLHIHITTSWLSPVKSSNWTICSSDDLWVFTSNREREILHYTNIHSQRKPEPASIPLQFSYPLHAECEHFIKCLQKQTECITMHTITRPIMQWLDSIEDFDSGAE